MKTFCFEIPSRNSEEMEEFQKIMDETARETDKYVAELATLLDVSIGAAWDIYYLRGRSRWTQEKEDYLIYLNKAGLPSPNIMEDFEVPQEM